MFAKTLYSRRKTGYTKHVTTAIDDQNDCLIAIYGTIEDYNDGLVIAKVNEAVDGSKKLI